MVLTGLSTEGITQMTEEEKKVSSCPVWKCNYTSVSISSSTVRCRKPDTSSLSSPKLAFGSVMSELLDSSSAGIPLPTYPRPVSSHIAAAMSDEASQPAEHHGIPVPLSQWQLVTCMHPTPSLPPSPCRFPVSLSFPIAFLKQARNASRWPYDSLTQLLIPCLSTILSFSIQSFFSCLLHLIPHPASSSLWGHRVRCHQSCWKALPHHSSHAKSALQDSGNRY